VGGGEGVARWCGEVARPEVVTGASKRREKKWEGSESSPLESRYKFIVSDKIGKENIRGTPWVPALTAYLQVLVHQLHRLPTVHCSGVLNTAGDGCML